MKKEKKKLFLMLFMLTVASMIVTFSFGKYTSNFIWDYYLRSRGFYFYSDTLNPDIYKYADNSWDESSIYFNLKNNLNEKVITEFDINYNVVCTIENSNSSDIECKLNGTDSNVFEGVLSSYQICVNNTVDLVDVSSYDEEKCKADGYDWKYQLTNSELFFDIEFKTQDYEFDELEVKIEVESTYPYKKKLIGKYFLYNNELENISYNYNDYENYGVLDITNNSVESCLKLDWNSSKLLIDKKSDYFSSYNKDENNYLNEVIFNINEFSNERFIFYKKDLSSNYSINDFNISKDCELE